jgi:acyl-CoA reductase-like NAD-dependent aldehyde dehydrogenase
MAGFLPRFLETLVSDKRVLRNFVNGESVDAVDGATIDLVNPTTGEVFATAPLSTEADVDTAYRAAATAFESWRDSTPSQRQAALLKIADVLEAHEREHRQAARPDQVGGDPSDDRPDPVLRRCRAGARGPRRR